jgi:hypothetical protein
VWCVTPQHPPYTALYGQNRLPFYLSRRLSRSKFLQRAVRIHVKVNTKSRALSKLCPSAKTRLQCFKRYLSFSPQFAVLGVRDSAAGTPVLLESQKCTSTSFFAFQTPSQPSSFFDLHSYVFSCFRLLLEAQTSYLEGNSADEAFLARYARMYKSY